MSQSRLVLNQLHPGFSLVTELMLNVSVSAIGSRISSRSRPRSSPTSLLPKFQHNVRWHFLPQTASKKRLLV